jgi:LysM repeat protein
MRTRIFGMVAAFALVVPAAASASFAHVVSPGESLSSVAATDGLSVADLAAANGISADAQLVSGSTLMIPPQSASVSSGVTSTSSGDAVVGDEAETGETSAVPAGYVVQPGDTLSAIAARAGISVASLAAYNGLDPNGLLLAGRSLSVPGATSVVSTAVPVSTSVNTAPAVGSVEASNGPYPTAERMSSGEVGSIGYANGASPSLTQAVGWQESGFNNDLVSSTGAVGIMQIEPGTWTWIQRSLTAGSALNPYSAADNVKAGALYLHSLEAQTGSLSMAAAGYYQGLASVQAHGMYSDTQQYVNSVMSLFQRFGGG